ncbi:MAG: excinuclease ABC subunit UvrC [Clostridiales bacterium]|nr:excinuclease ABC subunit UvrC [Clostridiales bacterium]
MFNIESELKKLPNKPGVYIMHDKDDKVIYVGKAISLKNRVTQYFRKNNKTQRIQNMVSLISYFEYIVTDNEAEALILECNLIKKYMPKFNVLLKDDKTYPYIKINIQSDYPDIYVTRRILNDGAKYFGPYVNSGSAKEMVDFIKEKFKVRQCKSFKYKDRPCLNYQINRCFAPCSKKISVEEYKKSINQIISILEGKTEVLLQKLENEMNDESKKMNYEKAAYIRDKIQAIKRISEKQKVSNINENDIDVIGIARNDFKICIEIFFVRNSKMIGREHYFYNGLEDETNEEIISNFLKQYYIGKLNIPSKIMLKYNIEDLKLIEVLLTQSINKKVEIKIPQKGEKLRLVEMAEKNAEITLKNKENDKYSIVNELKEVLNLNKVPRKIETFDISNISGEFMVAGMSVMIDGVIKKNLARRFKIKTVYGQDDPKCMNEVITRRLKQSIENPNGGFGDLPDLILVDGGVTQIRAAQEAISSLGLNISVFGMVKNDKHQTRALINNEKKEFNISEELLKTITLFQDSVHNEAIGYHRKLRDASITKSALDEIKGIGIMKKSMLLKKFGSVENIAKASVEDILSIKGINESLAINIKEILNKK